MPQPPGPIKALRPLRGALRAHAPAEVQEAAGPEARGLLDGAIAEKGEHDLARAADAHDGGEGARVASVTLEGAGGLHRSIRIERSDRLRATGRFYLNLAPFWRPDLTRVSVSFDRPLTEASSLTLCPTPKGDAS